MACFQVPRVVMASNSPAISRSRSRHCLRRAAVCAGPRGAEAARPEAARFQLPRVMNPLVWGTMRLPGNVIDETDLTEHQQTSGGKGGGLGGSYLHVLGESCAVRICDVELASINKIWAKATRSTVRALTPTRVRRSRSISGPKTSCPTRRSRRFTASGMSRLTVAWRTPCSPIGT